jgi:uncharacterized short protein YbdD (DUF466 family)
MWARAAIGNRLEQVLRIVRRVAGMPDYAAHVAHLRHCHPERNVPSPREYYEVYVQARYSDGPSRCC